MSIESAVAALKENPTALPLVGKVQHYDWGGYDFIPNLLSEDNTAHEPCAELWIGAHPSAPSQVLVKGGAVALNDLIAAAPHELLGDAVAARFETRLPYLFKVLDARKMLSIQAHPTKTQAEEGFAREDAAGIDRKAPNRNYKDDNHKPEVHVVLTDFWMLHSFRPLESIAEILRAVPEFAPLVPDFAQRLEAAGQEPIARKALIRDLYETVMTLPQPDVDAALNPLIARLEAEQPTDKDHPDFWALRASREFPLPEGHRDRGIFSIYLLNLLHLTPGQGTYQPAGVLHAYLEGVNMELMANSDNVLRGGLTPKHVDVPELMQTLTFDSGIPPVLNGEQTEPTEVVYPTPAPEFVLSRIAVSRAQSHAGKSSGGPDALIVLDGEVTVQAGGSVFPQKRGDILLVPPGVDYVIGTGGTGAATLYKAAVPAT